MSYKPKRGTVALEDAEILDHQAFAGQQFVLRVRAPKAARRAVPGMFAHISCDPAVPLRRPLSIMRANASEGWLEFLYKPKGHGLDKLSARRSGDVLSVLAPIGRGFTPEAARPQLLALGGGVGIPPMIFLADQFRARAEFKTLVLMGSEVPFPFELVDSRLDVAGAGPDATRAVALLERWAVPSRLASNAGLPGCYRGYVTELARAWLQTLAPKNRAEVQMLACGPTPMLAAAAKLAREFDLPCQLALEEFMACGIGGCAGCNVLVQTADGPAMKRVCVDGPVFDAREVFPT
ncbi:MAG TPA: dihydroorotate dehydrogenase electron transfer subunit [Gammaproteobacteria bacterium]|nr:dihydroorotate dehydrogenase electron transfer subunit [Gammaproteobacteria bacterium]